MSVQLEYLPGNATPDAVQEVWRDLLAEICTPDSEARATAESVGAEPETLTQSDLKVEECDNDFGTTILITFAIPLAVHVAKALFDDLVRPRLRRRYGVDLEDIR